MYIISKKEKETPHFYRKVKVMGISSLLPDDHQHLLLSCQLKSARDSHPANFSVTVPKLSFPGFKPKLII